MKLTGYYMNVVAKTERGITDIIVFDVKNRAEMVEKLNTVHSNTTRVYDFERHSFALNVEPGDETDPVTLAGRLALPGDCEVF